MENQKGQFPILILIGILVLVGVASGAYYLGRVSKSAQVVSQPQPTPQPTSVPQTSPNDETANWKTYTNTKHNFSINHPINFVESAQNTDYGFIGEKIYFNVGTVNPLECRGACPVVKETTEVQIATLNATKIYGYIGAIGGNIPQHILKYIFKKGDKYISFTLYARGQNDLTENPTGDYWPLEDTDIKLFDQILSTFRFE